MASIYFHCKVCCTTIEWSSSSRLQYRIHDGYFFVVGLWALHDPTGPSLSPRDFAAGGRGGGEGGKNGLMGSWGKVYCGWVSPGVARRLWPGWLQVHFKFKIWLTPACLWGYPVGRLYGFFSCLSQLRLSPSSKLIPRLPQLTETGSACTIASTTMTYLLYLRSWGWGTVEGF